jgi:hypothetical protein
MYNIVDFSFRMQFKLTRNEYRIVIKDCIFPLLHIVQTGFGAHPVSYTIGTMGSFPRDKATGV